VHRADVGEDADLRTGNFTQTSNLPGFIETHFQYHAVITRPEAQEGEGKANLIIEVALVLEGAVALRENLSGEFLGGGFADTAGDADDASGEFASPEGCQRLQRLGGILDAQRERQRGE